MDGAVSERRRSEARRQDDVERKAIPPGALKQEVTPLG